jgi:hypothetical protein
MMGGGYSCDGKADAVEDSPWWIQEKVTRGANDGNSFSEGQQEKFSVDAEGKVADKSKFDEAIKKLNDVRSRINDDKVVVMTIDSFQEKKNRPRGHLSPKRIWSWSRGQVCG